MGTRSGQLDPYRAMDLFTGISANDVEAVTSATTRVWFSPGKVLTEQRRPCRQFALVVEGTIDVHSNGDQIDVLGPGEHFGEFGVLYGLPHPTTLVARTRVTLDVVTATEFERTFGSHPEIRSRITHEYDRRVRDWVPWITAPHADTLSTETANPHTTATSEESATLGSARRGEARVLRR
jgi:CRP-like cAMP-binding protein